MSVVPETWLVLARLRSRVKELELDRLRWQNRAVELEEERQRLRYLLREAHPYVKGGPLREEIGRELERA